MSDYPMVVQTLANLATVFGIPIALWTFFDAKRKEQRDREYGTYDALSQEYRDFLKLCLEWPHLGIYGAPPDFDSKTLDPTQRQNREILLLILISLLERSYLLFSGHDGSIKKAQWEGWTAYMRDFAASPAFRNDWRELGSQFDANFQEFMNQIVIDVQRGASKGRER